MSNVRRSLASNYRATGVGGGGGGGSYDSAVAADAPIFYLTMSETSGTTAADSSGNSRPGSISGSPVLGATKVMPTGVSSYTLDDGTKFVVVADASYLDVASFSIEAWVTLSNVTGYHNVVNRDGSSNRGWNIYVKDGQVSAYDGASDHVGSATIAVGAAAHIVATCDSSTVKVYVNGALDFSFAAAVGWTTNASTGSGSNGVSIGASFAGTGAHVLPLVGNIDHVAYYGTVLSSTRVAAHYSNAFPAYSAAVLADSPLMYWKFDATSGTSVVDSSGNARNGVLSGASTLGGPSLISAAGGSMINPGDGGASIAVASWMETATFTHELIAKPSVIGGNQILCARDNLGGSPTTRHSLLFMSDSDLRGAVHTNTNEVTFVSGVFTVGQTYHLAMTYDGTTARAYINGALAGSFVPSGALTLTSGQDIGVGWTPSFGGIWRFNGNIDEYAYYGTALSGTRIAAHAAAR